MIIFTAPNMKADTAANSTSLTPLHELQGSGLFGQISKVATNLRTYWFLVQQLVKVEMQVEFRRSFLGMGWLLIVPLVAVAVWILLNGAGVISPGDTGIPYPAYVLLSTSIWGFFAEAYRRCGRLIESYGRLLLSTPFPVETLFAQAVIVHLIRFVIPLGLNLLVLLIFGVRFTAAALLFPFALLPLLLLGCGFGLLIAPLRLIATDITRISDEGIRLLMYLTPIVYAPKVEISFLASIIALNPLTYLVGFPRDLLTKGQFFEPVTFGLCSLGSLLFFLIALWLFRTSEARVRERLIAN